MLHVGAVLRLWGREPERRFRTAGERNPPLVM